MPEKCARIEVSSYTHEVRMRYKAVVFDLDGTLLNTLDDLAAAANRMLQRHGFPVHPTEAYRYFVGSGALQLVVRALPEDMRDASLTAVCLKEFLEDYHRSWDVQTRLYEGISALLDKLVLQDVSMAVLTNKPQPAALLCAEKYLAAWPFVRILGQREGVPVKPHPAGPHEVIQHLRVLPQEILYVGDTDVDMHTAVNAGMFPVGALWGFRPESELRAAGAQALIRHPLELLDLIEPLG